MRLSYTVKLYHATDITYYTWLTGVWTYPEMVSGILAACLPVSAKFFQALKDSKPVSRLGSSLKQLVSSGAFTGQGSTSDRSNEITVQSCGQGNMKCCPVTNGQREKLLKWLGYLLLKICIVEHRALLRERMYLTCIHNRDINRDLRFIPSGRQEVNARKPKSKSGYE